MEPGAPGPAGQPAPGPAGLESSQPPGKRLLTVLQRLAGHLKDNCQLVSSQLLTSR